LAVILVICQADQADEAIDKLEVFPWSFFSENAII